MLKETDKDGDALDEKMNLNLAKSLTQVMYICVVKKREYV